MPRRRTTGTARILFLLLLMAAVFFGVQYLLRETDVGRELHQDLIEQVNEEAVDR